MLYSVYSSCGIHRSRRLSTILLLFGKVIWNQYEGQNDKWADGTTTSHSPCGALRANNLVYYKSQQTNPVKNAGFLNIIGTSSRGVSLPLSS